MRTVRLAAGLAAALAIVACEPVIEPLSDTISDVPAPSFARHPRVVQSVTGGAGFYWIQPSSGEKVWRTSSLSARKYADGSVTGSFQANYHGLWKDRGRITCFTAVGNEAWLGVVIESSTSPNPDRVDSERVIYVQDNGEGSQADPDLSTGLPGLGDFESLDDYCRKAPLERPALTTDPLEAGNIQVLNPVVEEIAGSGGFVWRGAWRTFWLTAQRHTDGSVTGIYDDIRGESWDKGRITCFTVVGNEAWLGVDVETSSRDDRVGPRILYVVDNGSGATAEPDLSTALPGLGDFESLEDYCTRAPLLRPDLTVHELGEGDIQIRR